MYMEELHPDTVIFGNDWYTSRQKINNIPEPCWITIDTYHTFSDHLPTIFIQVEPQIIRQSEQYLIENHHKYHTIYTFNQQENEKQRYGRNNIPELCFIGTLSGTCKTKSM